MTNLLPSQHLECLPNEVLLGVLAHFSSAQLTPLSLISRRFASLVHRLLHSHLQAVASLPTNDLVFECFTPAAKLTTPSLDCSYVGTRIKRPGCSLLEDDANNEDAGFEKSPLLGLDHLMQMYSVFRPFAPNEKRRTYARMDGPSSQAEGTLATELIYLESEQPFEQLCAITNVVKPGPRPGLYVSHVNISDGVVRLWRDWLTGMADDLSELAQSNDDVGILWVNADRTVGLRMRVTHGPAERMPILYGPDDQPSVSFRLEYQELFVRTLDILWAVERSEQQEDSGTGTAVVIASMR